MIDGFPSSPGFLLETSPNVTELNHHGPVGGIRAIGGRFGLADSFVRRTDLKFDQTTFNLDNEVVGGRRWEGAGCRSTKQGIYTGHQ